MALSLVRVLCLWERPCGPELHGPIQAGGGDPLAIRAEPHPFDPTRVPAQGTEDLAGRRVADLDGGIGAPPGEPSPVGTPGHAVDPACRAAEGAPLPPRDRVPALHPLV